MFVAARRSALALLAFVFCATCACAQGWQHLGAVQRVEKLKDGVELTAGRAKVRITSFNEAIVRVRVAPEGNFAKDSSWAVIAAPQPPAFNIEDTKSELKMTSGNIRVIIQKSPLLIRFAEDLVAFGSVEGTPRLEGRNAHILISPTKSGKSA